MIIYEVNIEFDPSIEKEYRIWMDEHIHQMLSIEGFLNAKLLENQEQKNSITVWYTLKDQDSLDHYLNHHASKMRQEGLDRFKDLFQATRRVFSLTKSFESS